MTTTPPPTLPRSRQKAARREQLLDSAAILLVEHGLPHFTMEALATAAGVSKALPYQHFDNATEAIAALYEREIGHVAAAIADATAATTGAQQTLAAAVHAYFDVVDRRGPVLTHLAGTGSPIPTMLFGSFPPPAGFLVELIRTAYGCERRTANVAASIVASIAVAASDSVARGDGTRDELEQIATQAVVAAIDAVIGN